MPDNSKPHLAHFTLLKFLIVVTMLGVGIFFLVRSVHAFRLRVQPLLIVRAMEQGDVEKVWALVKANPELSKADAELLLAHGADINAKDERGCTPLHHAAYGGRTAAAELLPTHDADVNGKDKNGKTPLRLALDNGCKDVADLLREHGGKE